MSYWSTVVRTLAGAADYERSMHPDRLEGDGFKVGANPFSHPDYVDVFRTRELESEYFQTYVPEQLGDLARKVIGEYYLRIKEDRQKPDAIFFAEKTNNLDRPTRICARALFPNLKEVVLIRDPRDLLCSHMSYFGSKPDVAIQEINQSSCELMRIKREEPNRTLFIRYEDVILDAEPTLARLACYLGIGPLHLPNDTQENSVFRVHGTSASPQASVGRWRSELTSDQKDLCMTNWSEFLISFGYNG